MADHPPDSYRVVKLLTDVVEKAEFVARRRRSAKNPKRRQSVADYLSGLVASLVDRDWAEEIKAATREAEKIRKTHKGE